MSSYEEGVNYQTDSGSEYIVSGSSSSAYSEGDSDEDVQEVAPIRLSAFAATPSMSAVLPPQAARGRGRPPKIRQDVRGKPRTSTGRYIPSDTTEATRAHPSGQADEWDGNPSVLQQDPWAFTGQPRYNIEVEEVSPMSILEQFFDDEFFENLVNETNRYANQKRTQAPASGTAAKHGYASNWKPVNKGEMKKFIGLAFSMGIVRKPGIRNYWQKTPAMYNSAYWSSVMPRNRFLSILSFLHCNNNDEYIPRGQEGHNPLFKVDPVITALQDKFQRMYSPEKQLSLDEGTCPFKGRVQFRSYNPQKPHKWGIKIFELCEAESGYCLKFEIATGALSREAGTQEIQNLVMRIMKGYMGKGHEVYMDRYYSSTALFDALHDQKVTAVGTCRQDRRGLPSALRTKLRSRGVVQAFRKGNVLALKWKDKKEVLMLSTKHIDDMTMVSIRAPGGRKEKRKPVVIDEYNKHMCGVDKSDQRLSYYSIERKTVKWWRKLFFHLLNMTTTNAYIIYSKAAENKGQQVLTFLKFLESIVMDMTTPTTSVVSGSQSLRPSTSRDRLTGRHFPEYTPPSATRPHAQRDCYVCYQKMKYQADVQRLPGEPMPKIKSSKTQYHCPACQVALHPAPCFKIYHTEEDFSY